MKILIIFFSFFALHTGTASPSKRPTIFDVFRPRSKSDAKKKERELAKTLSTDHSASGSSTHSGGSGIMHSMKAAMQHTMGQRSEGKSSSKTKDGSAHPHGGSDAQVKVLTLIYTDHQIAC